jgi:peptide/nickel transport system substrate-binding protein
VAAALPILVAACAPAQPSARQGEESPSSPPQTKSITIGLSTTLDVFGVATGPSPVGGRELLDEIHSNGLVTSEAQSRKPTGQLAERVPSLDDRSVELLPDGRMRVTFHLRPGVTWHDGTPLTARDLAFSYRIQADPGLPLWKLAGVNEIEAAEAPDDLSFVAIYRRPYYRATVLGMRMFWPVPPHVLGEPYERYLASGSPEEITNHPYWAAEYIHLGPFRITQFKHGEEIVMEAHDRYVLGRPKVDVIRVRIFTDQDALLASVFAGAIDIVPEYALSAERGQQAKGRWEATGEGTVHVVESNPWFVAAQFRPHLLREPAMLDPRARAGFYHALDRETLSESLNGGNRQLAAWSILARSDELYEAARDGLRRYGYDAARARAVLGEAGWAAGPDGALRHLSDGRRLRTDLTAPPGQERVMSAVAAYWREAGIEVEETAMPPTVIRNNELRSQYPGWEWRGAGTGHGILGVFESPAAGPATRWFGNRPGYENPRMQKLIDTLYASPAERDQLQAMRAISELAAEELPMLMIYHGADHLGVRRGVKALDDLKGGMGVAPYGGYGRNSHLWDVQ